jgi:hypothetical protein
MLFSSFGVVLDCSIKKSYIDQSINRQCGYGFVHFASSQEGIESALAAVAGLNDATINEVCYKCSISHNLEKHLLDVQTRRYEQVYRKPQVSVPQPIHGNSHHFEGVQIRDGKNNYVSNVNQQFRSSKPVSGGSFQVPESNTFWNFSQNNNSKFQTMFGDISQEQQQEQSFIFEKDLWGSRISPTFSSNSNNSPFPVSSLSDGKFKPEFNGLHDFVRPLEDPFLIRFDSDTNIPSTNSAATVTVTVPPSYSAAKQDLVNSNITSFFSSGVNNIDQRISPMNNEPSSTAFLFDNVLKINDFNDDVARNSLVKSSDPATLELTKELSFSNLFQQSDSFHLWNTNSSSFASEFVPSAGKDSFFCPTLF